MGMMLYLAASSGANCARSQQLEKKLSDQPSFGKKVLWCSGEQCEPNCLFIV